ncbi:MAG TPA: hypothetical protein VEL31_03065, partial [Ktedonobacteraceae bacterium]|nr:hypothetical protein [Ktedonobacteraceae bacterium]
REYNLTLAGICERIGHPLPARPNQTSVERAKGQVHVMRAIANAVTDVRPSKTSEAPTDLDGDLDDNDLSDDLESHPF